MTLPIFLLLIYFTYGDSKSYLKAENTDLLSILPPIKVDGKTYFVETFFTANWFRANQFCTFNGMRLASISTQEESDKLQEEFLKAFDISKELRFWTSGNDLAVNGTYFWLATGADFQFQNWEPNQPDHAVSNDEEEHCIEIRFRNTTTLKWNDRGCSTVEQYILCEY